MISVIVPVYNEEKYIEECIESMLLQNYPKEKMEWFFVDGKSTDKTVEIIKRYQNKYPNLIKILQNEKKIQACAMNIGIKEASGKYIIRLDAHVKYPNDYINKCVHYLDITDSSNVGGRIITSAKTKKGLSIAKVLSNKFGVGNSKFRTNGSGYVDTVPFGAFRSEIFDHYGYFNEQLARNEDNEINYRIRKYGGKIYLAEDIVSTYYCRETTSDLIRQGFSNGKWNLITTKLCPGTMSVRHFVPLAFLLSLITFLILGIFFWYIFIAFALEFLLYLSIDLLVSWKIKDSFKEFFYLAFLFLAFHICYGLGSLIGVFTPVKRKENDKNK